MKLPPGFKYFVLASAVGLVAVILVQRYIATRTAKVSEPAGHVVVAELDIPPGTALNGRLVKIAAWPRNIIPPKAVGTLKQVEGRVVQFPIAKGEPILLSKLAPEGAAAGLGGLLDPNMLAVTVKTDAVSGVAGFINPADRVDVLVEMPTPGGGGGGEHYSRIILQNLKVLSRGQVWDQTEEKKPKEVPTVTLEVTPEQAEMLNLATFQGRIRLALRNQTNQSYFATSGVVTSQLAHRRPSAPQIADISPTAMQHSKPSVQVIRRMKVTKVDFEGAGQAERKKSSSKTSDRRVSDLEQTPAAAVR